VERHLILHSWWKTQECSLQMMWRKSVWNHWMRTCTDLVSQTALCLVKTVENFQTCSKSLIGVCSMLLAQAWALLLEIPK
jgi:hypothetical protein